MWEFNRSMELTAFNDNELMQQLSACEISPSVSFYYWLPIHTYSIGSSLYLLLGYSAGNSSVDKYLSPVSGSRTTIVLPAFSGRLAT